MPSLLFHNQHDATPSPASNNTRVLLILLIASVLTYIGTPTKHSLLSSAIAWELVWVYTSLKTGRKLLAGGGSSGLPKRLAWCAGGLLALEQICDRAVEGRGIWWAHGLLPLTVYFFLRNEIVGNLDTSNGSPPASPDKFRTPSAYAGSKSALAILTCSGVVAIFAPSGSHATIALGLSHTILTALAFLLVEKARMEAQSGRATGGSVIYSANGLFAHSTKTSSPADAQIAVIRDVSAAAGMALSIAALTLESFSFSGLAYWGFIGQAMGENYVVWQGIVKLLFAAGVVVLHAVMYWTLLMIIQRQGTFHTSFVPLFAAIASQLVNDFSIGRVYFGVLCIASTFIFFREHDTFAGGERRSMRFGRILTLLAALSFAILTVVHLAGPYQRFRWNQPPDRSYSEILEPLPPPEPLAPKAFPTTHEHPITQLVHDAEASWQKVVDSQSQTLEAAVTEYKRRYGIPPPPNFDSWYNYARLKGVQLIDEYDTIHETMLPFWGMSPATIRARAREAIGYSGNMLMGLAIRDGKSDAVTGGQGWMQQAAVGMIQQFVEYLPDMDIAFNTHDEPRVVVPHDDLSRLVEIALKENMPAALKNPTPKNSFSPRPPDVNKNRFAECVTTRFNWYAHQAIWDPSRLSCAPDTPARALDESFAADNLTAYAISELGFVYNHTAFSDICNSPSLASTFGFFERPNAFNTAHDLFPIFSQSKVSSYQDILYPSPWYWDEKVSYMAWKDIEWEQKHSKLFWRGSTTGGFSRDGGWKRHHRQRMIRKLNALDQAKILQDTNSADSEANSSANTHDYRVQEVPRQNYKNTMDVYFNHIGQCDPGDCDAQKEYFQLGDSIDQQDHWRWKFLLDMDGNAFSGRFYAFLKSKSLPLKMSIFREWHQEWLRPWVHYVPLSLRGDEVLESVRFFSSENEGGTDLAEKLAIQGREWADKALRNEDFEVWFFRVLLEYGRVIDDARNEIGYSGS